MDWMNRGYVSVHICLCDQVRQIGESGALGREGWVAGCGYSEVPRWWPLHMSIKDRVVSDPMPSVDLY
jgi:hypothetical protein